MLQKTKCPVCKEEAILVEPYQGSSCKLGCFRCGEFEIGTISASEISAWSKRQLANLSGWIREHQGCKIVSADLKNLANLRTPTVGEKAQKLLEQFAVVSPKSGALVDIAIPPNPNSIEGITVSTVKEFLTTVNPEAGWKGIVHPQLLAWSWSEDFEELAYLIKEFLVSETKEIAITADGNIRITPRGWVKLDSQRLQNAQSQIGFIAMWFDDSVKEAWKAIDQGIRDAGYNAFRIDQKEHNNDITDEIIAGIRKSRFLVADLTKHRNGVYFEAGFAMGLGLPVIWMCRRSDEKDRHFDIRQYNCIFWEEDKLVELSKALKDRIEATIGRGPLV